MRPGGWGSRCGGVGMGIRGIEKARQRRTQLISKCSQKYNGIDVIQRCESSHLDTLETYIIVSHKLTKDAYKKSTALDVIM